MADLSVRRAVAADATHIASLETAAGEELTRNYGRGHWSYRVTERTVATAIRTSYVLVAEENGEIIATLRLATKKPWAIDKSYFTARERPLYLTSMAVMPERAGHGVGRRLLEEAKTVARSWPANAIRLDAYDSPAGAGGFYASCGFEETGRATYRGTPLVYYEFLLT